MVREVVAENKEKEPTKSNLVVYWVRHGQAVYTKEEMEAGDAFGELTDDGIETSRQTALFIASKIDNDERVIIWASPKTRALKTAEIIEEILKKERKNVQGAIVQIEDARDLKTTKEGAATFWGRFEDQYGADYKRWMEFYQKHSPLPAGVETPYLIRVRVAELLYTLNNLAGDLPNDKRTHLIVITHEEMLTDLLNEGFESGILNDTNAKNGEVLVVEIFKDQPFKMEFRGKKGELENA